MPASNGDLSPRPSRPTIANRGKQGAKPTLRSQSGLLRRPAPGQEIRLAPPDRRADVCFVFDTTGSMYDKIDGLVECMVDFVNELAKLRLDWRITAVPFGDLTIPGDRVVHDLPFVATQAEAEQLLRTMPHFNGGGNEGESSLEAMLAALNKPYRIDTVKVLVLLTDEPPLQSRELSMSKVGGLLRSKEMICFVASPRIEEFQQWARDNGGEWYKISRSMDTAKILAFLRALVRDIAQVAKAVHDVGGGSVRQYLESSPKNRKAIGSGQ